MTDFEDVLADAVLDWDDPDAEFRDDASGVDFDGDPDYVPELEDGESK